MIVRNRTRRRRTRVYVVLHFILFSCALAWAQNQSDWVTRVRQYASVHDFSAAIRIVDARLQQFPNDIEALGWRARILAWSGNWAEAEAEYRTILREAPKDLDILLGLSDVLLWQGKLSESSSVLVRAEELQPQNADVIARRARLRELLREQSASNPQRNLSGEPDRPALPLPNSTGEPPRYLVSIGSESDVFNYTTPVQAQTATLGVQWSPRFSSTFSALSYRRLGSDAAELSFSLSCRLNQRNSISLSVGQGSDQMIAPVHQFSFDYAHGFKLRSRIFQALEISPHFASIWFESSQVAVLSGATVTYLPHDRMFMLNAAAARTRFYGVGSSWSPAASAKLSIPLSKRLRIGAGFGIGAENYSNIDQIGRISARTYLAEGRYRLNRFQDLSVFVAHQQRSHGQIETSAGGGYAFRF